MKGPQDIFAQLQGQVGQFVPDMARAARDDFEAQARATVMSVLSRLELVTREEFDAQQAVLMKTREKVEALEKRLLRWRVLQKLSKPEQFLAGSWVSVGRLALAPYLYLETMEGCYACRCPFPRQYWRFCS